MVKKMKSNLGAFRMLFVCAFVLLNMLFFSAVALYFFEKDAQPVVFGSITDTITYILLTFFTIGYSTIVPISLGGKLICIGVSMIGSLLGIVLLIGIVVWIFRSVSSYRRNELMLKVRE